MPCNGKLISLLRKQIGWTQGELARRAGFTERLIVKAEAGQSVASATLEILSQTLREAGIVVSLRDLASDPATLARMFFLSACEYGPNAFERNANFISDEIIVHFAGDPSVFPFAGTHSGIDAAKLAFASFHRVLQPLEDQFDIEVVPFFTAGQQGQGAIVWGEPRADSRKSMPSSMKFEIKMHFKDGLMTVFDYRFDTLAGAKQMAACLGEKNVESASHEFQKRAPTLLPKQGGACTGPLRSESTPS